MLAGAIGAASVLGGAFTSPLWAPVVDLGSAAVTAGIAAHAVHSFRGAGDRLSTRRMLRDAAKVALEQPDAPLAAHVIDVACRPRACDAKALRSAAMLVGRCVEMHARGIAVGLLTSWSSWCAPLREVSRVIDAAKLSRAATANAELVRTIHATALAQADGARVVKELPLVPFLSRVSDLASVPVPESFDDLEDMEEAA